MTIPQAPRVLSQRYELTAKVARGGMADVYRAHDQFLGRTVALKMLFPELATDQSFVERFRREAQAAANLSHPNIVPVFDWGEDGGSYYIVMEFVEGHTLSEILRSEGPLPPQRAAVIGSEVAAALSYAHRHGVVHRDIKPGNVLITEEGEVKVTDFGIARAINTEESLTQTGAVMGTATYFSPEQAEGIGVDSRSDIYSLGVVLYEMVVGRPPFLGDTPVAVASKHVREVPPPPRSINPAVPPAMEAIIMRAMAKSPQDRYQSANDLRVALAAFANGGANTGVPGAATKPILPDRTAILPGVTPLGAPTSSQEDTRVLGAVGQGSLSPAEGPEERSRTWMYVSILILLLAALGVVLFFLAKNLGLLSATSPAKVTVTNVVGDPLASAQHILASEGLNTTVVKETSTSSAAGIVLKTAPPAGASVSKGSTVKLYVSSGPPPPVTVRVPDVVTESTNTAKSTITGAGLKAQVVYAASSSTPKGIVFKESPSSGTVVNEGSTVKLYVSSGPPPPVTVSVPDVSGDTVAQAANILGQTGLKVGTTTYQSSSSVAQNDVIATSPPSGTQVAQGSSVDFVVSSGPSQAPVPNVVGDTAAQAESTLSNYGFTSVVQYESTKKPSKVGYVLDQSPLGGTLAPSGSSVTIMVGQSPSPPSSTTTTPPSSSTTSSSLSLPVGSQLTNETKHKKG